MTNIKRWKNAKLVLFSRLKMGFLLSTGIALFLFLFGLSMKAKVTNFPLFLFLLLALGVLSGFLFSYTFHAVLSWMLRARFFNLGGYLPSLGETEQPLLISSTSEPSGMVMLTNERMIIRLRDLGIRKIPSIEAWQEPVSIPIGQIEKVQPEKRSGEITVVLTTGEKESLKMAGRGLWLRILKREFSERGLSVGR